MLAGGFKHLHHARKCGEGHELGGALLHRHPGMAEWERVGEVEHVGVGVGGVFLHAVSWYEANIMPYIIRAMIGRRMNKQGIIRPSTRVGHTARLPMMMAVVLRKVLSLFFMAF